MSNLDLQTQDVVARLTNQTGAAEGSIVPPRQAGAFRVPFVTNLKVENSQQLVGTTLYTLTWDEPDSIPNSQLAYFNVYATTVATTGTTPTAPVTVYRSPAQVSVAAAQNSVIVFQVQTVLTSGLCSDLQSSPSCTQTVTASQISASQINSSNLLVNNLTLTNNSPSAGNVAWSAHSIYYQGTPYAIASGNTSVTTNKFLIWNVGDLVLTSVASYTPSPTIFLIATNTGGMGDTAWNKVALSHVQEDQLATSLLKGFAVQPAASITDTNPTLPVSQTTRTTNLLTINASAALVTTAIKVLTPFTTTAGDAATYNYYLQITVDGATPQKLKMFGPYKNGVYAEPQAFGTDAFVFTSSSLGTGTTANDYTILMFGLTCVNSLVVDLVLSADVYTVPHSLTGSLQVSCGYALKTSA